MALLHISVNRYIAVAYPHSYETRCNKRGTICTVVLGWLYSLVWTSLPFYGWGKLGFIQGTLFCNILWSANMAYAITVHVMCYFIPSILSAVLYLGVYKHVRSHGKRLFQKTLSLELTQYSDKKRTESTISRSIGEDNAPRTVSFDNLAVSTENIIDAGFTDLGEHSSASTRAKRSRRRKLMEARVTKVLLAVVMAFVCCWIPRGIANLWAIFESREAVPRALEYSSTVLVFFNAAVNPVLYGALHQDFQRAFRRIICCESNMNRSRAAINMSNSIRWRHSWGCTAHQSDREYFLIFFPRINRLKSYFRIHDNHRLRVSGRRKHLKKGITNKWTKSVQIDSMKNQPRFFSH